MNYETSAAERSALRAADHLRAAVTEGAQEISDKAAGLKLSVRDWWDRQSRSARDTACNVRDEAVAMSHRTQQYVRDEPVKSAFIVLAAGAVITGLVWLGMRRRQRF
jgi:ElaB/YqjD/DUF883 family membrane-anchored ribosome-binding protein